MKVNVEVTCTPEEAATPMAVAAVAEETVPLTPAKVAAKRARWSARRGCRSSAGSGTPDPAVRAACTRRTAGSGPATGTGSSAEACRPQIKGVLARPVSPGLGRSGRAAGSRSSPPRSSRRRFKRTRWRCRMHGTLCPTRRTHSTTHRPSPRRVTTSLAPRSPRRSRVRRRPVPASTSVRHNRA